MDRDVIERKLESLRHCLQRIETKCPADAETLATDPDLQDIVALNLSRAVQVCVDIGAHVVSGMQLPPPDTMGQTFDLLAQAGVLTATLANRMKKAVGFRNIAVHSYEAINWHIVHSIASKHLTDFSDFAKSVSLKCLQDP
ncbi:MAG TPA: DUF86 domain-containing protein [Rubrivivax sp.]|jgi:uncharacterized protein YutE (UPF0331/DUF86 family)|nr:DUF86 domain-containing protein [Rubrivivax sp.]